MHLWTKFRTPTFVASGTAILLALCVFLWGLEYKMSLYHPPHSFARLVPIAKLLSKNEQPRIATSAVSAVSAAPSLAPYHSWPLDGLFLLSLLPLLNRTALRVLQQECAPWWIPQVLPRSDFFVRPPPIQL